MAAHTSTGFCSAILGTSSFDGIFQDGTIEVYSGPQPTSADESPIGTLLARVTRDGGAWSAGNPANGLRFTRDGRFAAKDVGHRWVLSGLAAGTAGWYRLLPNAADAGDESFSAPRIDGSIGVINTSGDFQMLLPSVEITTTTAIDINYWWYAMPPIGD